MIDTNSILKKLEAYSDSAVGKDQIVKYIKDVRKRGGKLAGGRGSGNGSIVTDEDMKRMADDFIQMVKKRLPQSITSVGDTLHKTNPTELDNGDFSVTVKFDHNALYRESLLNDEGYEGIDNIVALFNNGYNAKAYVYGWWSGHKQINWDNAFGHGGLYDSDDAWVRSAKDREALHFMQEAVAEFNAKYAGKYSVTINLGDDYKK